MKRRLFESVAMSLVATLFVMSSCIKDEVVRADIAGLYFDFNVKQKVALDIDYCFANGDYVVLFELYDRNPMVEDANGEIVKEDIEPIYRAATNGAGRFSGTIEVLSALTKVWLYSDYPGVLSPVPLDISAGRISFNNDKLIASMTALSKSASRAVTGNNYRYPDGWLTLGDWDRYGTPDYIMADRKLPKASTLYKINEIFVKYNSTPLQKRFPEFFREGISSDVKVLKPTKVYLTFINSSASWYSSVGYYTYPTGSEPTELDQVKRVLAYPNVTPFIKRISEDNIQRGALVGGDRVQLRYWDGTKFVDEFPAGVSIGWWLEGRSFGNNSGNISFAGDNLSRMSTDILNKDGIRRTVALRDADNGQIVALAFEDNVDMRYNDATFFLEVDKSDAIDSNIPTIPDVGNPPKDDENFVTTYGTLTFEDLWPSKGDYDMNDVMIKYNCKVYKQVINNAAYKTVSEFTPYHSGGFRTSAFGYALDAVALSSVHSVTIDSESAPSRYMEGKDLEPGQSYPVVVLFDNLKEVVGKTFTVTMELNDIPELSVVPPYNPFIIPNSDISRDIEVHLPKYRPTDKMDRTLLGTQSDKSKPDMGLYYVNFINGKQYPFALNLVSVKDMPVPAEGTAIDTSYPNFRAWVESMGQQNKDWYLYPQKK